LAGLLKMGIELSPHLEEQMADRDFNEVDLRATLEKAKGFSPDIVEGTLHLSNRTPPSPLGSDREPSSIERRLIAVTAYPVYRD
jgi:hypothetical protein